MSFLRLRETMSAAAPAYLALSCFGLAASPAAAQDGGQEAKRPVLGGVTVTDTAIEDDGYKIDKPSSPKFTQPLRATPPHIQVISKALFKEQIGSASCRERVGQYVLISVVAVSYKKKI